MLSRVLWLVSWWCDRRNKSVHLFMPTIWKQSEYQPTWFSCHCSKISSSCLCKVGFHICRKYLAQTESNSMLPLCLVLWSPLWLRQGLFRSGKKELYPKTCSTLLGKLLLCGECQRGDSPVYNWQLLARQMTICICPLLGLHGAVKHSLARFHRRNWRMWDFQLNILYIVLRAVSPLLSGNIWAHFIIRTVTAPSNRQSPSKSNENFSVNTNILK